MLLLRLVPLLFIKSVTVTTYCNWELNDLAWASQMALVVKNLPANAGGMRYEFDA